MGFTDNSNSWEGFAQEDALWAILTDPSKKRGRWNRDDFFKTGGKEIQTIASYLKQHGWMPTGGAALDFGCGVGRLSRALSNRFERVIGVDVSETMIRKAAELNLNYLSTIEFRHNPSPNLDLIPNNSIAFIYSAIVLQHISKREALFFVEEFLRKLEPNGIAVFQLPTKDIRKVSLLKRFRNTIRIRERLAGIGIGKVYPMEMNVFEEEVLDRLISKGSCTILDKQFTNHTNPAYNGDVKFINEDESQDFVSRLYVVRKQ